MGQKRHQAIGHRRGWRERYARFEELNGDHPFKAAVPDGYVDYRVRSRKGGTIFYFNFELAREMGLIPSDHSDELTADLARAILDTFGLQIINEYDMEHGTPVADADLRPHSYMATRYLQLQHPSRKGYTSGDGRSIWNGCLAGRGGVWDVSSCGTGATRLSPATAIHGKFYRTGDPGASYGCGRSDLWDGASAALMSEILHNNGIATERTLAVIGYGDQTSINVRAYRNLLRPAHFFLYLKQGDYARLKAAVDCYIERQVINGAWPALAGARAYRYLARRVAADFARAAARFESDYIFCWLDWDGDNILTDGAIIDYGSLRQFGLFHHEYRYDDVERMSTTITEQRAKARYIVQTFIQLADFLISRRKRSIRSFGRHPLLALFDRVFQRTRDEQLLYKIGFAPRHREALLGDPRFRQYLGEFEPVFSYFERAKSARGPYQIPDGITWDAIFCMRDILRELPALYRAGVETVDEERFIEILRSRYATDEDVALYPARRRKIRRFQTLYRRLLERAVVLSGLPRAALLAELENRSSLINRYDRITGDAVLFAAKSLIKSFNKMNYKDFYKAFRGVVEEQILCPESISRRRPKRTAATGPAGRLRRELTTIVKDCRDGL